MKIIIQGPAKSGKSTLAFTIQGLLSRINIKSTVTDPDGVPSHLLPLGQAIRGPVEIETVMTRREPEQAVSAKDLQARFGHQHPDHPLPEWRCEVANGDTILGYWEWVANGLEGVRRFHQGDKI